MAKPVVNVAVNASGKGVIIWDFIRNLVASSPLQLEFALYSSTDRMNEALRKGEVDIAWHGPMGYVQTIRTTDGHCGGIGMRDGDVDYKSLLVTPPGSDIRDVGDLVGKRVAIGHEDSLDNTVMPLFYLRQSEIGLQDVQLVRPLGPRAKEVDYQGEAAGVASVREGRADAAFVGYKFWDQVLSKNEDGGTGLDIVWESPPRGHCVFATLDTIDEELASGFMNELYKMDYSDPEQRQIMDLEWLKAWVPAKMEGAYDDLLAATQA